MAETLIARVISGQFLEFASAMMLAAAPFITPTVAFRSVGGIGGCSKKDCELATIAGPRAVATSSLFSVSTLRFLHDSMTLSSALVELYEMKSNKGAAYILHGEVTSKSACNAGTMDVSLLITLSGAGPDYQETLHNTCAVFKSGVTCHMG